MDDALAALDGYRRQRFATIILGIKLCDGGGELPVNRIHVLTALLYAVAQDHKFFEMFTRVARCAACDDRERFFYADVCLIVSSVHQHPQCLA